MTATERPKLLCAADLAHIPEAVALLEENFDVDYAQPNPRALQQHLPRADAYFAALSVRLTAALLEKAPRLKAVTTPSTGTDHLDLQAAAERDIAILSLKSDRELLDRITATAELTWALLLACARHIRAATEAANRGHWARDVYRGHQLAYKTFGILGCGRLGSIVAQYANAFRMKVIAHDPYVDAVPGVEMVGFDELLLRADVFSIHVHLNDQTRGLIDRDALAKMKPGAILLNTSRGAIVDEAAMIDALDSGHLSAAGVDVIDGEWLDDLTDHPLLSYARSHENLVVTPHIGGVTYESQAMAYLASAEKIVDFFRKS
ncbi:MAG: NAD(P)-dependent oxidoreductase [Planctomycetota bacterium]|nr:NAD(P)-dependent oxidoreductase [Planctomycetota bacterium]